MKNLFMMLIFSFWFSTLSFAQKPPKQHIVAKNNIKVEYFVYGKGAQTLLMIAGNGRWAKDLEQIAYKIAQNGIRVVTINHRGIEGSEGDIEKSNLHDLASDIWLVADDMKAEKVHLAGKTFGQRIMRTASADKPDRVLSLTLMGAGGEILPEKPVQEAYKKLSDPNTPPAERLELLEFSNFAAANKDKAKLSLDGGFPKVAGAQVLISNRTPLAEWGMGGTAPMLILQGLEDKVAVPQNGFNLATKRPNTWLVGIPNCGHNMVYEKPLEVAELITAFIKKIK
jgi:pimeloyl-ACP methyl ester carboxylesterase